MSTLATLDTVFGANTTGLIRGIATAESKVVAFQTKADASASKVSQAFAGIATAGAAVGAALVAVTVAGIGKFEGVAGEVRTLEKQLGTTAEQASALRAEGEALGVGVDKLSTGFGIFSKHLVAGDAVLQQYGLTVARTATGQIDFGAEMDQLTTLFASMPPGVERTAAAMNLFGKSGKSLLPILSANSDELATIVEHAREAGLIMSEDDVQAARKLVIAQRELRAAFDGLEVSLARAVIPALTGVVDASSKLVRAISPALPLIRNVGVAFLAYKALSFVPILIESIAVKMTQLGLAMGAPGLLKAAGWMDSLAIGAAGFTALATGATLFTAALVGGTAALVAWDPLHLIGDVDRFNKALAIGTTTVGEGVVHIGAGRIAWSGYAAGVDDAWGALDEWNHHANRTAPILENTIVRLGMSKKAFQDFKSAVVDSVQVAIGDFANLGDAFKLTAVQLRNQANAAVAIARREHSDLRAIFESKDLSDGQKKALALLPADMRDAFVHGGKAVREQIATDAVQLKRLNAETLHQLTTNAGALLEKGGKYGGSQFGQGLASGMNSSQAIAKAASARIAHLILEEANAVLGIHSPSLEGRKIGQAFIEGVELGMSDKLGGLADAVRGIMDVLKEKVGIGAADQAHTFARELDQLAGRFDKLKSKIATFADAVKSGFAQFDLIGGAISKLDEFNQQTADFAAGNTDTAPGALDLAGFAQQQADQAKALADMLQKLATAGLNRNLLANLASQGPAGLAFGQQLLNDPALIAQFNASQKEIAQALGTSLKNMIPEQFGPELKDLRHDFLKLDDGLAKFLGRLDSQLIPQIAGIISHLNALLSGAGLPTVAAPSGGSSSTGGGTTHLPQGTGGHGSRPRGHVPLPLPGQTPPIIVHFHGPVIGTMPDDVIAQIDEGLSRKRRTNGQLALDGRG